MRQTQTLALLSRDLHRNSVVPIVQSLTAVQSSKVQSDLKAGSNSSRRSNRSTAALRSKRSQTAQIVRIASCSEACAGWMFSSPLMTDKNTSHLLSQSAAKHALDFPAGCLMSHHAHFVAVLGQERSLTRMFGAVHRRCTRMVNFREGRRGPLWHERFLIRWTNGKVWDHS